MNQLTFVSIIIPIRNESNSIIATLTALINQDYKKSNFEILIVDGRSSDNTLEKIKQFINQTGSMNIKIMDNPREIFSAGFNIGLAQAKGDIIVMMGGHAIPSKNYISQCVSYLSNNKYDCVGGYIENISTSDLGKTISIAMNSWFGVGGVGFRTKPNRLLEVDTVAFGAYKKVVIEKIGLINEEFVKNQDDEFNYRLRKFGGKILLAPDIHIKYYTRATLQSLWKQYFLYGLWKVRVLQYHPKQMKPRQFIPPLFVLSLIVPFLLSFINEFWIIFFIFLISIYSMVNLLISISHFKRKNISLLALPLVYIILHFSYGIGFLFGTMRFMKHWQDLIK